MTTEYKLKNKTKHNYLTASTNRVCLPPIILTIEGRGRPLLIPTICQSYYPACAQCQMPKGHGHGVIVQT